MGLAEMTYCSRRADLEDWSAEIEAAGHLPVMVAVADPALCNGCSLCYSYLRSDQLPLEIDTGSAAPGGAGLVVIDDPLVMCSNMKVCGPEPAPGSLQDGLYRLTAADIEFLAELDA